MNILDVIKLLYEHCKFLYTKTLNKQLSNVWFDRHSIAIEAKESRKSMALIYPAIHELIKLEHDSGISLKRIIFGGFSMGGALALHTAYHINTEIAGVFACSAFLNRESIVYESLVNRTKLENPLPELIMFHGERDDLVPIDWGEETFNNLKNVGVKGEFYTLKNTLHELKKGELLQLQEWLTQKLPPLKEDIPNKL